MHNFRVPPSPTWYSDAVCTPNNGFLYVAGNHVSIAYIPPIEGNAVGDAKSPSPNIRIIPTQSHIKAIACDPDWSDSPHFVTMNNHNFIWVWNVETGKIVSGHRAHVTSHNGNNRDIDVQAGGAMCITRDRQVLSADLNALVKYCLVSNTYTTLPDNFITKRNAIAMMRSSPYNGNMVAFGYRNGLILIADIAETVVLHKIRGHDAEIVSLEWMKLRPSKYNVKSDNTPSKVNGKKSIAAPSKPSVETPSKSVASRLSKSSPKAQSKAAPIISGRNLQTSTPSTESNRKPALMGRRAQDARREPAKPIVDADDMFDMFTYDYEQTEFGATGSQAPKKTTPKADQLDESEIEEKQKSICVSNDRFDFVEACQSLRSQIVEAKTGELEEGDEATAVNMSDIRQMKALSPEMGDISLDALSLRSTIGSSHNQSELADLEQVLDEMKISDEQADEEVFLASGSLESFVVIWNTKEGRVVDKIIFKPMQNRSPIPKPNCTIAWIRPEEIIVCAMGRIAQWKMSSNEMKFVETSYKFADLAVISIYSNVQYNFDHPIVWSSSMYLNLNAHKFKGETIETIAQLATLPIGMFSIQVCPHDPNKIAIAGNNKRIGIVDLCTLKPNNIQMSSLTVKIQAKVQSIAWHPVHENLLSFSTNEGRVGTFNLNKPQAQPEVAKDFNGKEIYQIRYGIVYDKIKSILYATNMQQLMLFNDNFHKSADHKFIEFPISVSAIGVSAMFVTIGMENGRIKVLDNDAENKELAELSVSTKFISSIAWSPSNSYLMAVASCENHISLVKWDSQAREIIETGRLIGHTLGVASIAWSKQIKNCLVSASSDCSVRVWDTEALECIAWIEGDYRMTCAEFMPTDENYVICSGYGETMYIFDVRERLVMNIGELVDSKKKKKSPNTSVDYASKSETQASKLREQEKKKLRKLEKKQKEAGEKAETECNDESLAPLPTAFKFKYTTIMCLSNKELNKDPLNRMEFILKSNAVHTVLTHKLFGDRESVREVLATELENHQRSNTESIGNILIPLMSRNLRESIVESIKAKRLTEQELSVAPMISFEFWKNSCFAFAMQCIDKGSILQAIPYLLSIHRVTEAIDQLCQNKLHREAWCIAKLSKESEDPIFDKISTEWVQYLEDTGNLEAAALISYLASKLEKSIELLNKRKVKTTQLESIIATIESQRVV